jgi:hypothetical protein
MELFRRLPEECIHETLVGIGLGYLAGGCAYRPSYSSYGYYHPYADPYGPPPAPSYQSYAPPQSYQRPPQSYQLPPPAGSYQFEPLTPSNDNQPIILNPARLDTGS